MTVASRDIRLADLVEHADHLDALVPLSVAQPEFARSRRHFLGVVAEGRFVGVVSGREITELLSMQFGHALFGRAPVGSHVMARALAVAPDVPLTELLRLIAQRSDAAFDEDVALVSAQGEFVGLVPMHRLVRLQTSLLLANLAEVDKQRHELADRNRRMEDDLRMAREVQLALLGSKASSVRLGNRAVAAQHVYEAADVIGGDFFSVFEPRPGTLACFVCDVMGHGVRPALITAILRVMVSETHPSAADPGAMLTGINANLMGILRSVGDLIFVTAAYAVIDLASGELRYAQAGHPPPLLWRQSEQDVVDLPLSAESAGPALGLLEDSVFTSTVMCFDPGDALFLFTDGLIEATSPEGEEFGAGRLREAFAAAVANNQPEVAGFVVDAARGFAGVPTFADDVCALVVRCDRCLGSDLGGVAHGGAKTAVPPLSIERR